MGKFITGTKTTTVVNKDEKGNVVHSTTTTVEYDMGVIDTGISQCCCDECDECDDDCANCIDPCGPQDLPEPEPVAAPSNVASSSELVKRKNPGMVSVEEVLQGLISNQAPKPVVPSDEVANILKHLEDLGFKLIR